MTIQQGSPELDDEEEFDIAPAYEGRDFEESVDFFRGLLVALGVVVGGLVVFGVVVAVVVRAVTS